MGGSTPTGPACDGVGGDRLGAVGVFTTDTSLTVRTWDEWLAQVTGIAPGAACGRPLTELIPDLASRGLLTPFQQVLSRGLVEILAPAFHRYLIACPPAVPSAAFDRMQQRVTIGPMREEGRVTGTIVAIEDVTDRVERERALAAQLSHLDPEIRLRAAHQLADAEPLDGADPLLAAIRDDNWQVRRAAVKGLSRRNTTEVIAAVLQALPDQHRDFNLLSSAVELITAGEADVVEPLIELLRYPDPDLRLQAALVLGERGDTRALPALVESLADPDENLRFHAIEALGKLKAAAAVDRLADIAESGDFFLAFPALEALSQIGESSVAPRLAPLLTDELLRGAVAEVLGEIGDEDVVAPLTQLLNEATAPTEVVADALAAVYDRYERRYQGGDHIAHLVRRTITATGTQKLLDAVHSAGPAQLRSIAKLLAWLEGPAVDRALTLLLGQAAVRSKVVEYLVRHGERVVQLLIEQLGAEDLDTRHAAVVGLGRIGDRRATPALLEVLQRDPALTVVTAGALARIGDDRAFEALLARLGDPDPAVRQAVIAALNSIGHPAMAARIVPLLQDPRPHVRESAVRIAGYFGYPTCADELIAACSDRDPTVRRAALEHAAFLEDDRVVPILVAALDDPSAGMRAAAIQALARLEDARAVPPLLAALRDGDAWVRYFAAKGLGEQRYAPALDELTHVALDDGAGHVRLAAIDALGRIGSGAAIPVLAALTTSDDGERATAAIRALGHISDPEAWPPLQAALRTGGDERRAAAAESVACLGGARGVDLLEWTAGADNGELVVAAAIRGLASIAAEGRNDTGAVKVLIELTADPGRRDRVIPALAALPPALIDRVAHGLRDPRANVRVATIHALGRMRHAEASQSLQAALDDPSPEVRLAALTELRHLGTRGVDRRLVTIARGDEDPVVRRAAMAVLRKISGGDPEAGTDADPTSSSQP